MVDHSPRLGGRGKGKAAMVWASREAKKSVAYSHKGGCFAVVAKKTAGFRAGGGGGEKSRWSPEEKNAPAVTASSSPRRDKR